MDLPVTPKFKGIKITMGDLSLVCPPLNFRSLQMLQDRLKTFNPNDISPASLDLVVDATHAALQRNYPAMTRDEVIDGLDLENMIDVMQAVMDVSGMKRKAIDAADAPVQEDGSDPSTGPSSTPT